MKKPENHIMVIFGASGDLTERKLMPALYDLFFQKMLPDGFAVIGVGRTPLHDDTFRDKMTGSIKEHAKNKVTDEMLNNFQKLLHYVAFDTQNLTEYKILKDKLSELNKLINANENYVYYLATPPVMYEVIPAALARHGLNSCGECGNQRKIVLEKPFGYDLKSAKELNKRLLEFFTEDQIFRIDHYLGKETAQNILVTRFSNGFFEPIWNNHFIQHVEITAAESLGIERRGGYYEGAGALRDMVQNHLMQLTGLIAMEPPAKFDATSLRNETIKVFHAIRPYNENDVARFTVRGQYGESMVRGEKMNSYLQEHGVKPESKTETYVALKFFIDNWRWEGVPFYIRTGKRLPTAVTEIVIHLKPVPHQLFRERCVTQSSNMIILRIQPDEGIALNFGMKIPGAGFKVQNVNMDFHYSELSYAYIPSAYERLLLDCMNGDSTLYTRADALEATWSIIDPVLNAWKNNPGIPLYTYPSGSWGPEEANALFDEKHIKWRYPCKNINDDKFCEL